MTNRLDWPPPFTLRKSQKSKRISLQISPHKGLVIVVPHRVNTQKALEFLEVKREWVEKHLFVLSKKDAPLALPDKLHLKSINQTWLISYLPGPSRLAVKSNEENHHLLIIGNCHDEKKTFSHLHSWLKEKAKFHLENLIRGYSHTYQLPFESLTIRNQKSRWGSCSTTKNISLNFKLLFLEKELVHYVMVHELAHTLYFDHSPRFWKFVEQYVPNYRFLKSKLKKMEQDLPNWL